jgi:hypothetical protein
MIQGVDDYGATGYSNDRGSAASEGFLAIAISSTSGYTTSPCGASFPYAQFVVMEVVNPSPTPSCESGYSVQADPLPVNLLFFSGVARHNRAVLSWATAGEQDNSGFSIQKSPDALTWESVGFVAGNGTAEARQSYTFTDADVLPGHTYYYKLRQRDTNGRTDESKPVAIRIDLPADQVYLYPNPSTDGSFRLRAGQKEQPQVELLTLTGTTVPLQTSTFDSSTGEVSVTPMSALATGLYHVQVRDAAGQQRVLRLLVNRP